MMILKYTVMFLFLSPLTAYADGEPIDCSESCPDGQVMVSFADGNNATCICEPAAEMEPTVPNPDVQGSSDS